MSNQLSFTLRTSPNCKSVHLVGNWDGYKGQLPLSKDDRKAGAWKGTFRFQGSTLKQGQRYWYYYLMDGYQVSHDPAKPFTVEPTTGRKLNILDVPATSSSCKPSLSISTSSRSSTSSHARRSSKNPVQGRGISPSRIISPKPHKPSSAVEDITRNLSSVRLRDQDYDSESDSDTDFDSDSDVPSLSSSRSSASSRSSECSSPATPTSSTGSRSSSRGSTCSCQRFGITRKGERVRLDCKGSRCGGSSGESSCGDSEEEMFERKQTRRQGVIVKSSGDARPRRR